jgi:hypothetical protein
MSRAEEHSAAARGMREPIDFDDWGVENQGRLCEIGIHKWVPVVLNGEREQACSLCDAVRCRRLMVTVSRRVRCDAALDHPFAQHRFEP